jgi:hypothetical protein
MTQKIYKSVKKDCLRQPRELLQVKNDEKSDILLEDPVQIE